MSESFSVDDVPYPKNWWRWRESNPLPEPLPLRDLMACRTQHTPTASYDCPLLFYYFIIYIMKRYWI